MGGLRRIWLRVADLKRRIAGFSTPFDGVRPRSDTSFDRAKDERELMDEIWRFEVDPDRGTAGAAC
jgi:hypothetical protein